MSKKTAGLARTHIRQYFNYLRENANYVFDEPIRKIGIPESVCDLAEDYGIKSLNDLEMRLNDDEFIYEFEHNGKKLTSFARGINSLKKKITKNKSSAKNRTVDIPATVKTSNEPTKIVKIKRVHLDAVKKIETNVKRIIEAGHSNFLDKTLKAVGVSRYCYGHAQKAGFITLRDIYDCLDKIIFKYNYVQKRLKNLAENVEKVCKAHLKGKKTKASKSIDTIDGFNECYLKWLEKRTSGVCCLCCTFSELLKISEKDFIKLMRSQYPNICDYKLSKEKIKSWRDEYAQLTKTFIPVIKKDDKNNLKFHIVFELQLPKYTTALASEEHIYSDAVIVGDDGFVVLEFKQRKSDTVDFFESQALKYIKRLRFHKIGRKQRARYTYLVFTKEPEDGVWCYGEKEDFWFGNTKSVARDLCSQFFEDNNPNKNIIGWLTAGFKEKRTKKPR